MKKVLIAAASILIILLAVVFLGPRPDYDMPGKTIEPLDMPLSELDTYIEEQEAGIEGLKAGNASRIYWADSIRKTPIAMVYLHGFSAGPKEGDPVHLAIARQFGMNLYIPRIAGHGIDSRDSFVDITPEHMMASAREAIAVGNLLGDKVIVMSCSTGGTYSIFLAAHNPDMIDALIMYSPNLELYDQTAKLITGPWGAQLAETVGGKYRIIEESIGTEKEKYTTTVYRIEGIIALQKLLEQTMTDEVFAKVNLPTFIGYYYKNENEMDDVISIERIKEYLTLTTTPQDVLAVVEFENAGTHVVPSGLDSKDITSVIEETEAFITDKLNIPLIQPDSINN